MIFEPAHGTGKYFEWPFVSVLFDQFNLNDLSRSCFSFRRLSAVMGDG